MKTNMHQNSLETFESIIKTLPASRAKVFEGINEHQPCTRQMLSRLMDWPINRITGRVTELLELNLIQEQGSVQGPNDKPRSLLVIK
jgi:hypothetical protein